MDEVDEMFFLKLFPKGTKVTKLNFGANIKLQQPIDDEEYWFYVNKAIDKYFGGRYERTHQIEKNLNFNIYFGKRLNTKQ